jgi:hypothetical protein
MTLPIATTVFPNVAQTTFTPVPEAPLIGDVWEGEIFNPGAVSYFLPSVVEEAQITSITFGANAPGDILTVTIDGAKITATAGADLAATTAAVEAAIEAAAIFAAIVGVTSASPVATLTFLDYEVHTVSVATSGATTIVAALVNAAVSNAELDYGMWAAKRSPIGSFLNVMGQPSALSDQFAGVLFRVPGSAPFTNIQVETLGFNSDWLPPNRAYLLALAGLGIVVQYSGTAPTVLDPVYRVATGANYGKWAASDLGVEQVTQGDVVSNYVAPVAQVTRGDVVFNGTDDVGVNVDGMAPLFVPSDTSDDITVAALVVAWNASPAYFALATATADTSGAESWFILTFKDDLVHTMTAYSPATATVNTITNTTAAVAEVEDLVGLTVDSLPTLSVNSITDDDTTATALVAAWNASSQHSAVASAAVNLAGATSLIVLTFLDTATHTVTAYSPATADVTSITNSTAAVAATAVLQAGYSWGRPSIASVSGQPNRAFLRLSPA